MGNMKLIQEMQKKLGFGCMRLPILDGKNENIDFETFERMIDAYMQQGFCYFDTAYPYHNEKSEEAVKKCLVARYPREAFYLADKMPVWLVKEESQFQPIFDLQLERTGVEYFDFYLLHALDAARVNDLETNGGFEFIKRMKVEGKVKNIGFSFHDSADVLEQILSRHPEVDFVQLQLNYYDWESENVQSHKCYEVAVKYQVPVIVMEPVKGGTLANLIGKPAEILKNLDDKASFASYAIRYVASLPNVMMVLSGMSDEKQMLDNIGYMKDFQPLDEKELQAIADVCTELEKMQTIGCTNCRYCVKGCPQQIQIPSLFAAYNMSMQFGVNNQNRWTYQESINQHGKPSDCISCGACEEQCPQHLHIRDLLKEVESRFE